MNEILLYRKYYYFIVLIIAIGCSSDPAELIDDKIECLDNTTFITPEKSCEDLVLLGSICEQTSIGEFSLDNNSKEFMVYSCLDLNDTLEFENSENELITFVLSSKTHFKSNGVYNTLVGCSSDSSKYMGLCLLSESISWRFSSTNPSLDFMFRIRTKPDINEDQRGKVGDFLTISRKTGNNSYRPEFDLVISQRTLDFDRSSQQEFYETIGLEDEEFENVYSVDRSSFGNLSFKYFYNKTAGLFAFIDESDILWKRVL